MNEVVASEPEMSALATLAELPDDSLIDVRPMSRLYACSVRHVWRAADAGLIPAPVRVGRLVRWRVGTIREHIRNGCKPVRPGGRA
jgi:predicted DNA-binding transcriptional regulator AlpA